MKRAKKLTRGQAECVRAHYLIPDDWLFVQETEFYYKIINKKTGARKSVDKFRREKTR